MTEREQLLQAIVALEAQRSSLGDDVVDTALGPLREKLAALDAAASPAQQRKQVTVLFADVMESTRLSHQLKDPERVLATMGGALQRMEEAVRGHGGRVLSFMGDGLLAVFGLPQAREDDAERAVRAGLVILEAVGNYADELRDEQGVEGLAVRVGINSGLIASRGHGEGDETVMGLEVNLAARLESAAPPNGLLISHATYRLVRGLFDMTPLRAIWAKGFPEPILVYQVQGARPRTFRMETRGVEGVKTRMIGRDDELRLLQDTYHQAMDQSQTQAVVVVGEAGVGKSRLLYEFINWLGLRPDDIYLHLGRAMPGTQNSRLSLFRNLFAMRFDILESDSAATALVKIRTGFSGQQFALTGHKDDPEALSDLLAGQADVIGHWLGFDFSGSAAVSQLAGNPEFALTAQSYLRRYLRNLGRNERVVFLLEDIHWADDSSLDLILNLLSGVVDRRLLIVCLARPALFERRPKWGSSQPSIRRIELQPLSQAANGRLVDEILQRAAAVPDSLRDLIIAHAEGNPYYTEELIKMLIDDGVISASETPWQIDAKRLLGFQVPPTLASLLQSRLDALPAAEREIVQRAAVVGRRFWDTAVCAVAEREISLVQPALDAVRRRELVLRLDRSAFTGTDEYAFRHSLLRDVAYETVLLRERRLYHARVARWLETNAGERLGEYVEQIAEHYRLAGQNQRAAGYLERAGHQALAAGAYQTARDAYSMALDLRMPDDSLESRIRLGEACWQLGEYATADDSLARALRLARLSADRSAEALALYYLSRTAASAGDYARAQQLLEESLPLARAAGGDALMRTIYGLGSNAWRMGELDEAKRYTQNCLALAQEEGDVVQEIVARNLLGLIAGAMGDTTNEQSYYEQCLELARKIENPLREAVALGNLGAMAIARGEYAEALTFLEPALRIHRELGRQESIAVNLTNVATLHIRTGDLVAARREICETIRLSQQMGAIPRLLGALQAWAELLITEGDTFEALKVLGLIRAHPVQEFQTQDEISQLIGQVDLGATEVEAALMAGASFHLADVVANILAEVEA